MHTNKNMEIPKSLMKMFWRGVSENNDTIPGAPDTVNDLYTNNKTKDNMIHRFFRNYSNMMQGILH